MTSIKGGRRELNTELDLSSQYDYRMSEIVKIKKYMKNYERKKSF